MVTLSDNINKLFSELLVTRNKLLRIREFYNSMQNDLLKDISDTKSIIENQIATIDALNDEINKLFNAAIDKKGKFIENSGVNNSGDIIYHEKFLYLQERYKKIISDFYERFVNDNYFENIKKYKDAILKIIETEWKFHYTSTFRDNRSIEQLYGNINITKNSDIIEISENRFIINNNDNNIYDIDFNTKDCYISSLNINILENLPKMGEGRLKKSEDFKIFQIFKFEKDYTNDSTIDLNDKIGVFVDTLTYVNDKFLKVGEVNYDNNIPVGNDITYPVHDLILVYYDIEKRQFESMYHNDSNILRIREDLLKDKFKISKCINFKDTNLFGNNNVDSLFITTNNYLLHLTLNTVNSNEFNDNFQFSYKVVMVSNNKLEDFMIKNNFLYITVNKFINKFDLNVTINPGIPNNSLDIEKYSPLFEPGEKGIVYKLFDFNDDYFYCVTDRSFWKISHDFNDVIKQNHSKNIPVVYDFSFNKNYYVRNDGAIFYMHNNTIYKLGENTVDTIVLKKSLDKFVFIENKGVKRFYYIGKKASNGDLLSNYVIKLNENFEELESFTMPREDKEYDGLFNSDNYVYQTGNIEFGVSNTLFDIYFIEKGKDVIEAEIEGFWANDFVNLFKINSVKGAISKNKELVVIVNYTSEKQNLFNKYKILIASCKNNVLKAKWYDLTDLTHTNELDQLGVEPLNSVLCLEAENDPEKRIFVIQENISDKLIRTKVIELVGGVVSLVELNDPAQNNINHIDSIYLGFDSDGKLKSFGDTNATVIEWEVAKYGLEFEIGSHKIEFLDDFELVKQYFKIKNMISFMEDWKENITPLDKPIVGRLGSNIIKNNIYAHYFGSRTGEILCFYIIKLSKTDTVINVKDTIDDNYDWKIVTKIINPREYIENYDPDSFRTDELEIKYFDSFIYTVDSGRKGFIGVNTRLQDKYYDNNKFVLISLDVDTYFNEIDTYKTHVYRSYDNFGYPVLYNPDFNKLIVVNCKNKNKEWSVEDLYRYKEAISSLIIRNYDLTEYSPIKTLQNKWYSAKFFNDQDTFMIKTKIKTVENLDDFGSIDKLLNLRYEILIESYNLIKTAKGDIKKINDSFVLYETEKSATMHTSDNVNKVTDPYLKVKAVSFSDEKSVFNVTEFYNYKAGRINKIIDLPIGIVNQSPVYDQYKCVSTYDYLTVVNTKNKTVYGVTNDHSEKTKIYEIKIRPTSTLPSIVDVSFEIIPSFYGIEENFFSKNTELINRDFLSKSLDEYSVRAYYNFIKTIIENDDVFNKDNNTDNYNLVDLEHYNPKDILGLVDTYYTSLFFNEDNSFNKTTGILSYNKDRRQFVLKDYSVNKKQIDYILDEESSIYLQNKYNVKALTNSKGVHKNRAFGVFVRSTANDVDYSVDYEDNGRIVKNEGCVLTPFNIYQKVSTIDNSQKRLLKIQEAEIGSNAYKYSRTGLDVLKERTLGYAYDIIERHNGVEEPYKYNKAWWIPVTGFISHGNDSLLTLNNEEARVNTRRIGYYCLPFDKLAAPTFFEPEVEGGGGIEQEESEEDSLNMGGIFDSNKVSYSILEDEKYPLEHWNGFEDLHFVRRWRDVYVDGHTEIRYEEEGPLDKNGKPTKGTAPTIPHQYYYFDSDRNNWEREGTDHYRELAKYEYYAHNWVIWYHRVHKDVWEVPNKETKPCPPKTVNSVVEITVPNQYIGHNGQLVNENKLVLVNKEVTVDKEYTNLYKWTNKNAVEKIINENIETAWYVPKNNKHDNKKYDVSKYKIYNTIKPTGYTVEAFPRPENEVLGEYIENISWDTPQVVVDFRNAMHYRDTQGISESNLNNDYFFYNDKEDIYFKLTSPGGEKVYLDLNYDDILASGDYPGHAIKYGTFIVIFNPKKIHLDQSSIRYKLFKSDDEILMEQDNKSLEFIKTLKEDEQLIIMPIILNTMVSINSYKSIEYCLKVLLQNKDGIYDKIYPIINSNDWDEVGGNNLKYRSSIVIMYNKNNSRYTLYDYSGLSNIDHPGVDKNVVETNVQKNIFFGIDKASHSAHFAIYENGNKTLKKLEMTLQTVKPFGTSERTVSASNFSWTNKNAVPIRYLKNSFKFISYRKNKMTFDLNGTTLTRKNITKDFYKYYNLDTSGITKGFYEDACINHAENVTKRNNYNLISLWYKSTFNTADEEVLRYVTDYKTDYPMTDKVVEKIYLDNYIIKTESNGVPNYRHNYYFIELLENGTYRTKYHTFNPFKKWVFIDNYLDNGDFLEIKPNSRTKLEPKIFDTVVKKYKYVSVGLDNVTIESEYKAIPIETLKAQGFINSYNILLQYGPSTPEGHYGRRYTLTVKGINITNKKYNKEEKTKIQKNVYTHFYADEDSSTISSFAYDTWG